MPAPHRCGNRLLCQRVRQLSCKSALGFMLPFAPLRLAAAGSASARVTGWATIAPLMIAAGGCLLLLWCWCTFALGRLRGVGPEQFIFQRRTVEAANDRLHFVRRGRFYERESFGFLRLVVADNLNRIRYQVFSRQPLLNIVGGDPRG